MQLPTANNRFINQNGPRLTDVIHLAVAFTTLEGGFYFYG